MRKNSATYAYDLVNVLDIVRVRKQMRKRTKDMAITSITISPEIGSGNVIIALTSSDGIVWTVEWRDAIPPTSPSGTRIPPALLVRGELEGVTSAITSLSVYTPEAENLIQAPDQHVRAGTLQFS